MAGLLAGLFCLRRSVKTTLGLPLDKATLQNPDVIVSGNPKRKATLCRERAGITINNDRFCFGNLVPLVQHLTPLDIHGARNMPLGKLVLIARIDDKELLSLFFRDLLGKDRRTPVIDKIEVFLHLLDSVFFHVCHHR